MEWFCLSFHDLQDLTSLVFLRKPTFFIFDALIFGAMGSSRWWSLMYLLYTLENPLPNLDFKLLEFPQLMGYFCGCWLFVRVIKLFDGVLHHQRNIGRQTILHVPPNCLTIIGARVTNWSGALQKLFFFLCALPWLIFSWVCSVVLSSYMFKLANVSSLWCYLWSRVEVVTTVKFPKENFWLPFTPLVAYFGPLINSRAN